MPGAGEPLLSLEVAPEKALASVPRAVWTRDGSDQHVAPSHDLCSNPRRECHARAHCLRVPRTVAAHIALLAPHLGGRAYSLRSAIVIALGHLIARAFVPAPEDEADAQGACSPVGLYDMRMCRTLCMSQKFTRSLSWETQALEHRQMIAPQVYIHPHPCHRGVCVACACSS